MRSFLACKTITKETYLTADISLLNTPYYIVLDKNNALSYIYKKKENYFIWESV